jgi:hypothetical protein
MNKFLLFMLALLCSVAITQNVSAWRNVTKIVGGHCIATPCFHMVHRDGTKFSDQEIADCQTGRDKACKEWHEIYG